MGSCVLTHILNSPVFGSSFVTFSAATLGVSCFHLSSVTQHRLDLHTPTVFVHPYQSESGREHICYFVLVLFRSQIHPWPNSSQSPQKRRGQLIGHLTSHMGGHKATSSTLLTAPSVSFLMHDEPLTFIHFFCASYEPLVGYRGV